MGAFSGIALGLSLMGLVLLVVILIAIFYNPPKRLKVDCKFKTDNKEDKYSIVTVSVENIGKKKLPDSEVAGQASVLIFPDLNTGNNTYKAVQRETGAVAIGPMLQGLNKPVNDLSRGCTVDDIFNTIIITAIQAQ